MCIHMYVYVNAMAHTFNFEKGAKVTHKIVRRFVVIQPRP